MRPNILPQALLTAAILARTGRLWITKDTSFRCCLARFCACPRIPNPVMSVAACALKVCMSPAATIEGGRKNKSEKKIRKSNALTILCTVWMKLHTFNSNQVGLQFKLIIIIKKIMLEGNWNSPILHVTLKNFNLYLRYSIVQKIQHPSCIYERAAVRHVLLIYISSLRNRGLLQIQTSQSWGPERL